MGVVLQPWCGRKIASKAHRVVSFGLALSPLTPILPMPAPGRSTRHNTHARCAPRAGRRPCAAGAQTHFGGEVGESHQNPSKSTDLRPVFMAHLNKKYGCYPLRCVELGLLVWSVSVTRGVCASPVTSSQRPNDSAFLQLHNNANTYTYNWPQPYHSISTSSPPPWPPS
jgi:hypothetical protein